MRPYLLEECHEVLDALDAGDAGSGDPARVREELGDLLFQVLFLARLGEERGDYDLDSVARGIHGKMVERHPHVFGEGDRHRDPGSIAAWENRKQKAGRSRIDGVPGSLPALVRAHRVAEKAAAVGFDWPDLAGVRSKVTEELMELDEAVASGDPARVAAEYGDVLLALANLGRFVGVAGEDALRMANARFETRFRAVEASAVAAGVPIAEAGMARLEGWWQDAKRAEGGGP
jgi:ATP diphosphatase